MAERDELGRALALARETLRGPVAMKARVRAQLAGGALAARVPVASPARPGWLAAGRRLLARRYPLATVTLLVGAGFGAGFWLGRLPRERPPDGRDEAAAQAAPTDGALATHELAPAGTAGPSELISEAMSGSNREPPRAADGRSTAASDAPANAATLAPATATSVPASSTTSARPATRRRPEPRSARMASDDALVREVALLERIDRAIRAGEGGLAVALLDELDRSVPTAALRDERAAARVLARCVVARDRSSGAWQQAHASAERFLASDAASVYADRIRAACRLDATGTNESAGIEERSPVGH
jgi:hypothetical protein